MEKNVGELDRSARLVIGAVLVIAAVAAYAGYIELGIGLVVGALVVGLVLLVTGTAQKCPINQAAGINTLER